MTSIFASSNIGGVTPGIPSDNAFKIVEIDASEIGFGGILKQVISLGSPEQIVRFHSGFLNNAQINYQSDLLNQNFFIMY
jgi:hypothetical protein